MSETYDVVLLVEQELSAADAAQVRSLHEAIDDPVVYHVLLPLEDAAARIEAAMGSLAAGEVMASPAMVMSDVDLDAVRRDCEERSDTELSRTLAALRAAAPPPRVRSSPSPRSTRWPPRSPRSTVARRSS